MNLFSRIAGRRSTPSLFNFENLDFLLYLRGRLIFADLVARTLRNKSYDLVLVDLPSFMNNHKWLNLPLQMFPLISMAVFKRHDGDLRSIPFMPNDAACLASYLALQNGLSLQCIDDSDLLNYPQEAFFNPYVPPGDDSLIWQRGLKGFFDPLWAKLDEAWESVSDTTKFFTRHRGGIVLRRLDEAVTSGKRILFVCEFHLFYAMAKAVDTLADNVQYLFQWKDTPGILRFEDPQDAWVHGLLDDYPAVNMEFWNRVVMAGKLSFDKVRVFDQILSKILAGKKGEEADDGTIVSIRARILFLNYLKKLSLSHHRILPDAGAGLFHAAEACGGNSLYQRLAREFLRYPNALNDAQTNFILQNAESIIIGGPGLDLPDYPALCSFFTGKPFSSAFDQEVPLSLSQDTATRREVVDRTRRSLTREEENEIQKQGHTGTRWAIMSDYRLHDRACEFARHLASKLSRQVIPKRSWGNIAEGIHWPATIMAKAQGEKSVYTRHRINRGRGQGNHLDEHTPIAFIFEDENPSNNLRTLTIHEGNISKRNQDLGNRDFPFTRHPAPDHVYSVYGTSISYDTVYDHHLHKETLTTLTLVYTKAFMGTDRYKAIMRRPKKYQCRLTPDNDPELHGFSEHERGLAWAIKYASTVVILVARKGWVPTQNLSEYAEQKGIKIIPVPLSAYRDEFITRLQKIYFLSTPLKKHSQREQIIRRFVE